MRLQTTLLAALLVALLVVVGCYGEATAPSDPTPDNNGCSTSLADALEQAWNEPDQKTCIEGAGDKILALTEGIREFAIVDSIEVYQQGDRTWAEVNTLESKDWDDGGWCEEVARLTILNAFTGGVVYLDEARVRNKDGAQIASKASWLPKE